MAFASTVIFAIEPQKSFKENQLADGMFAHMLWRGVGVIETTPNTVRHGLSRRIRVIRKFPRRLDRVSNRSLRHGLKRKAPVFNIRKFDHLLAAHCRGSSFPASAQRSRDDP